MQGLDESRIIELDAITKKKVETTLGAIEDALKGWGKEKGKREQGMSERITRMEKWRKALVDWNENYSFSGKEGIDARLERLQAFYELCKELGGEG